MKFDWRRGSTRRPGQNAATGSRNRPQGPGMARGRTAAHRWFSPPARRRCAGLALDEGEIKSQRERTPQAARNEMLFMARETPCLRADHQPERPIAEARPIHRRHHHEWKIMISLRLRCGRTHLSGVGFRGTACTPGYIQLRCGSRAEKRKTSPPPVPGRRIANYQGTIVPMSLLLVD